MSGQLPTEARAAEAAELVRELVAALNDGVRAAARLGVRTDLRLVPVQMIGGADHAIVTADVWVRA